VITRLDTGKRLYLLAALNSCIVLTSDFMENLQLFGITEKIATGDFRSCQGNCSFFEILVISPLANIIWH
jgi:hypothetical protein